MFDSKNFSYRTFLDHVMQRMHLENTEEPIKTKIEKEIARILGNRIITTVMNTMTEDNLTEFDILRTKNPDLADLELLFMYVENIPALSESMIKSINDLADELTYDAARLDKVLEEKNTNK
ncbi:hypothetical protein JW911_03375 [Candidatus Peregrinibacteria bacterium]|nr:hypothetical protein [Candidatus Peregrinibacteria bacterium]